MKTKLNFFNEQYSALYWTFHSTLTQFVQVHGEVYVLPPQHDKHFTNIYHIMQISEPNILGPNGV